VAEWQTRRSQTPLRVTSFEFESRLRHCLERIVGNLLDNAREHAPWLRSKSRSRSSPAQSRSQSRTTGTAWIPARLERIFERFYKADPSRHGGSSGLELAIAAEHAALLGGTLTATNRAGGGLRVELGFL
jgi:signal transduction histidine kinase